MQSSQKDTNVTCLQTCTKAIGYSDYTKSTNLTCYYDFHCTLTAPYAYARGDGTNPEIHCEKECNVLNGTIDESNINATWCLTDFICLNNQSYYRKRSDGMHTQVLCMSSCTKLSGYILNKDCYYGTN